jgi:predicted DsbA family dithiol-disulfide isomerase
MIGPGITKLSPNEPQRSPATLQVDIIADLICPWSFLGKRRLDDALASVRGPSVITWFPFQLNPDMPAEGMPLEEYLASKFGDPEMLKPGLAQLTTAGKDEGIDFRFDLISHIPNTLDAHRVMNLAEQIGANTSLLADKFLRGFFTGGLDISDRDVLVELGGEAGLGSTEILMTLEDELSKKIVLAKEAQVRRSGVTGVPDFLVNKRLFVVGAQRTDNLVNVFDRAMFGEESDLEVSATLH